MFSKLSGLAAVVSFGLFTMGCAAEATDSAASSDSEVRSQTFVDFKEGTFALYDAPNFEPTDACDVHTVLTLSHGKDGATATLRDVVTGVCFLYVEPNERTFTLSSAVNRCNVQTFSGETKVDGEVRHIAIIDSRASLCDTAKADIVVDEYDQTGVVTSRFTQQ
jgi:hypothetical protein